MKHLPNTLTLMNLSMGILSILSFTEGEMKKGMLFICLAALFDSLDGRIARLLKVDGDFGKELDSLADIVTFGVAPAIFAYEMYFQHIGALGLALTLSLPLCGAIRLAKFNTETYKVQGYFIGVPITLAGLLLTLLLSYLDLHTNAVATITLALSFLMVSPLKVPNFKEAKEKTL